MDSRDTRDDARAIGDPEQNVVRVEADRIALRRVFEEDLGNIPQRARDPMTWPSWDDEAGMVAIQREL
jgi:hypothetical protein